MNSAMTPRRPPSAHRARHWPRLATLAALLASAAAPAAELRDQVDQYRVAHEAAIVGQLDTLTRLKSIAADPAGLTATAAYLVDALKQRGFDAKLLSAGSGNPPAVFGYLKSPAKRARTVVFYAHYDGQPVTPSQWTSDPFVPVMRSEASTSAPAQAIDWRHAKPPFDPEWRLFGRAVSDDKASIAAFLSAFDSLKALHKLPSVTIKVLWEGEEEAGSAHLGEVLRANQELLAADLFLIGDGPVHQSRRPMVYFGARGTLGVEATVYGPVHALHDGHYGNWVPNPAVMAAHLIAQMRDEDGKILIPGFTDSVLPLTPDEQHALAALPSVSDALKREFEIGRTEGSDDLPTSIMRPALNVRGIRTGQVGAAAANAIPTEAAISIDFRLVPDQTPATVRADVEKFIQAAGYTIVADEPNLEFRLTHPRIIRLVWEGGYPALRSDMSTPAAKAVIAAAAKAARAPLVVMPMAGGSVPIYLFSDVFKVPVVCLPVVNHDNNQHAANENLRLQNLWDGIDTYAALLAQMSW